VTARLSWFHIRNYKSNSKEKANSRFLHASYTFCMTKKDLIGGWVGVGQLLVAARRMVRCINNPVFVIKTFKMPNFTNVELTDMALAYDTNPTRSKHKYCTGNGTVILFIVADTDNLIEKLKGGLDETVQCFSRQDLRI
jgi:hypothetical protein